MTADQIAALATIAARLEMLRERLARVAVPVHHLRELNNIQSAVEGLYMPEGEASEDDSTS